jgi:hypothetical protein
MATDDTTQTILLHPWFPKTEPPMAGGSESGTWMNRDRTKLGEIAQNLVYEVSTSRVNSLPSPWSRALQFEQAILNERYPTRAALLSELFGCLATVSLSEIVGVKLQAERVALRDHVSSTHESVTDLARSLYDTKPSSDKTLYTLANGGNPWEELHVLKADNVVIGFTSPATLLCPAVHLPQAIEGMQWTAGGHFADPTRFLSSQQKQSFADWLKHVGREILAAPDLNYEHIASQLNKTFDSFIEKLTGGQIGNPILSETPIRAFPLRPRAISLLARAAKGPDNADSQATLQLGDRLQRPLPQTPQRPVILLDPDMPQKLGIDPTEITLYKSSTLASVGFDKKRLETLYGNEIDVLTPEDIFMKELYLLPEGESLASTWLTDKLEGKPSVNGIPITPLLPFKERIRDLFTSEELAKRCTVELETGGGISTLTFSLLLNLENQDHQYYITQVYPLKESNLIDEDLPVIALWPYISDISWKHYVIFAEDRAAGLTVDGFPDYQMYSAREGVESMKYFTCDSFPDLIKLCERNSYRGLIPVKTPPPSANTSSNWSVGIDFGTSFTNFYINNGYGPKRFILQTRVIPLTRASEENKLNLLYKYFIPETLIPKDANPPTSTAVNIYGWQELPATVPDLFHQARVQWPSQNSEKLKGSSVRTGFKWHQLQYQRPFLKEIALLISSNAAIAGAKSVDWSVSYPSAFSLNEARNYQRLWEKLCTELTLLTGLKQQIKPVLAGHSSANAGASFQLQTEAVAFASYFGNYHASQMVHTACLDVGGGTTDISIWQENKLLHQVSVPFAGRDICTRILHYKPSFISVLFPNHTATITSKVAELRQDPNFSSWFDNILRIGSPHFLAETMPILRNEKHPQLIHFASLMAISFAGIYHYLGIILAALAQEKLLKKSTPMEVYLGGNGANFLHWLDESGSFSKGCDADRLFETLQRQSLGSESLDEGSASTMLSDAFKDETACGLISEGVNLQGNFDPSNDFMIAGEETLINGKHFSSKDRVRLSQDIDTVHEYMLCSLVELKKFVMNYDLAIAKLKINTLLPVRSLAQLDKLWYDVEIEARSICLRFEGKSMNDIEPVPGFIIALSALSKVLAKIWSEKY